MSPSSLLHFQVTKSITEEQWVANFNLPKPWRFPRLSSWSKAQQRFIVDMTARYWATGIPTNPHPSEERNVRRLMVGAPREGCMRGAVGGEGREGYR